MRFFTFCVLIAASWLLFERAGLSKDLALAKAQIEKMEELQKKLDFAQFRLNRSDAEVTRLREILGAQPLPAKDDAWFQERLKPKIK